MLFGWVSYVLNRITDNICEWVLKKVFVQIFSSFSYFKCKKKFKKIKENTKIFSLGWTLLLKIEWRKNFSKTLLYTSWKVFFFYSGIQISNEWWFVCNFKIYSKTINSRTVVAKTHVFFGVPLTCWRRCHQFLLIVCILLGASDNSHSTN